MATQNRSTSRADQVRARRAQRARQKIQRKSRRAVSNRNMPPMVARTPIARPASRTRGKDARRRYNLSLGTAGAELRLPALPTVRVGWRLVSALMAVFLVAGIYAFTTSPRFDVRGAGVVGVERVSALEINAVLGVAGSSVFVVQPADLVADLQAKFPELTDVSVSVGFPNRVVVSVGERQPVLSWEQNGVVVWIDRQGIGFLPRGQVEGLVHVQAAETPPMTAVEGEERPRHSIVTPSMVAAVLALSEHAPEGVTLLYDPEHGFGWVDPRGWQVYFGPSPLDVPQRLAVYEAIVAQLVEKGINPALISVEYLHAPFYRTQPREVES